MKKRSITPMIRFRITGKLSLQFLQEIQDMIADDFRGDPSERLEEEPDLAEDRFLIQGLELTLPHLFRKR